MVLSLVISSIVIFCCVISNKFSSKLGMPALICFMALGMLFGSDGILKIPFDNYVLAEKICTVALLFIIFYGGFGVKWEAAKPICVKAGLLASMGVLITAGLTGLFCYYVLNFSFEGSFLTGAVLSSTDAASVFSILRSKKLNLKHNTAPLLEIESGSNDPFSYMLTIIGISIAGLSEYSGNIFAMIFLQIIFGAAVGIVTAYIGKYFIIKKRLVPSGMEGIFIIGMALFGYGFSAMFGGNGFISVYLMGIIMGNFKLKNKIALVHFFDGFTGLAQILIFFLLGLLSFPSRLPAVFISSVLIALFLMFVSRPIAVFSILKPFKADFKQCLLVSWAGLRGAASIVFAIFVISAGGNASIHFDIFHIVFMVSLLSVSLQGSLLPVVAKKLDMVDEDGDVRKNFNDYQEESALTLMRIYVPEGHNWVGRTIGTVNLPTDSLAIMIKRAGSNIVTKGDTVIEANDDVILSVPAYSMETEEELDEVKIDDKHKWCGRKIAAIDIPKDMLIAMIKRNDETIIPRGDTVIKSGDIVITYR